MVKIRLGINTCFALRRWTNPKQWMELIHSKFELDMCELSLDLLDPMLREPTKTEYMHEILELGDTYPIDILSTRTGNTILTQDMLLNPNFGQRIQAVQWYEKAIDIAAYTNSRYVGGYFGGLVIQEHSDPKMMDYLIAFLIDGMSYLASIAYTAGLFGIIFEPFSLVPDGIENIELNFQILEGIRDNSSLSITFSPIARKDNFTNWINNYSEEIHLIQIRDKDEAKSVKLLVDKLEMNPKSELNVILNQTPPFDISPNEAINSMQQEIGEIKNVFKLT